MKNIHIALVFSFLSIAMTSTAQSVFINEIKYKGLASSRGVEVAGPKDTNMDNWNLCFYDGTTGDVYHNEPLSGTIGDEGGGFAAIWYPVLELQDRDNDAVALVNPSGSVVQFISYSNSSTTTANDGCAVGETSQSIGTIQNDPIQSIQLQGTGFLYPDFLWIEAVSTPSSINNLQIFNTNLPIELIDFIVEKKKDNVLIKWRTENEYNNEYFVIEKSTDGINFEDIATIMSQGNTPVLQRYEYSDKMQQQGVIYYRLKQVDYDERSAYSEIVFIRKTTKADVTVYPIIVNEQLHVQANSEEVPSFMISISDLNGRLIMQRSYSTNTTIDLNLNKLPVGSYIITTLINTEQSSQVFFKQ